MDDGKSFEEQLESIMTETQEKMTGEIWQDIRTLLRREQEIVRGLDQQLLEFMEEINEEDDAELQKILDLAHPETEAQFWRELHQYRSHISATDESVGDVRVITTNSRMWLRSYIMGVLLGIGERADALK